MYALQLVLALLIDKIWGEPDFLWKKITHPIVFFGTLINRADLAFNKETDTPETRFYYGVFVSVALLLVSLVVGGVLSFILAQLGVVGMIVEACIAAIFLAYKSLFDHVKNVHAALVLDDVALARERVGLIVGRDTHTMDEAQISRAACESLAENFSDGVIAPAFFYLILGLPGIIMYKMLNTADSMIGHLNEKYCDFGCAAARLDDVANFIPARLTGLLFVLVFWIEQGFASAKTAFLVMKRDAALHKSPNSGWPEAAMAGGLEVALAGPRIYHGRVVNDEFINPDARSVLTAADIERALGVTQTAHILAILLCATFIFILH